MEKTNAISTHKHIDCIFQNATNFNAIYFPELTPKFAVTVQFIFTHSSSSYFSTTPQLETCKAKQTEIHTDGSHNKTVE